MSDFLLDIVTSQNDYLCHHGIKGQKWGERRYQNPDGSLTDAGRLRYRKDNGKLTTEGKTKLRKTKKNLRELENKVALAQIAQKRQFKDLERRADHATKAKKGISIEEADKIIESGNANAYMKEELNRRIENYKKYADYAMKTFGDQKLDTMKYDKEGNPIARKNNAALVAGSAIVTDLVAGPAAAVGVGLLVNAVENEAEYRDLKKKAAASYEKRKEKLAKEREIERKREEEETKKEIAEFRKKHKDLDWVSDEDLIDYYMD